MNFNFKVHSKEEILIHVKEMSRIEVEFEQIRKSHKELEQKLRDALDELAKLKRQYEAPHRMSYHE